MKTREQIDLENLALFAELSRQLAHDFSNFLYNLLLQIEIGEKVPKRQPTDWSALKQEGKRMAARMQQWDRFHNRFSAAEPCRIDLHQLIRQVVADGASDEFPIRVKESIAADALWLASCPLEVTHLLRLMLEQALHTCEESGMRTSGVSIETEMLNQKVVVRVRAEGGADAVAEDPGGKHEPTLVEAACRSLALRLDATFERATGSHVLTVEFPLGNG